MDKPFLAALLPRDQTFEEDEAAVHMQKQEEANAEAIKAAKLDQEKEQSEMLENMEPNSSLNEISNVDRIEFMENPFIRPVKLPLVSKKIAPHV